MRLGVAYFVLMTLAWKFGVPNVLSSAHFVLLSMPGYFLAIMMPRRSWLLICALLFASALGVLAYRSYGDCDPHGWFRLAWGGWTIFFVLCVSVRAFTLMQEAHNAIASLQSALVHATAWAIFWGILSISPEFVHDSLIWLMALALGDNRCPMLDLLPHRGA